MPLGILNNIPSLAAENQLTLTSTALSNTLQQLSSGSRINSGADDPAGLSIANGLQANISALTQSVSNANNGVGQLQLADGALAQVTTLLNTAVTLATESATGTVSNGQRTAIQAQYASILAEINRIGTATTYNGQAVFQSGTAPNVNAADSANNGTTAPVTLTSALTVGQTTTVTAGGVSFTYTAANATATAPNANQQVGATGSVTGSTSIVTGSLSITAGGKSFTFAAGTGNTVATLITAINASTDATGAQAFLDSAGKLNITDPNNNGNLAVTATGTGGTSVAGALGAFANPVVNVTNPNQQVGSVAALTGASVLTAADTFSITADGKTSTFTNAAASTVSVLLTAINTGATSGGVVLTGTANTALHAFLDANGHLNVTDSSNGNNLNVITAGQTATDIGTFAAAPQVVPPTVQTLINAINADTTVGAKAALVGGQVQITDPLNRADITVSTTDSLLGAPVNGAPTKFTNPNTVGTSTINTNEIIGNVGTSGTPVTAATALTNGAVTSFTAGGKTFSFTAGASSTVGDLIAALNNPTDPAGLRAYLGTATGSGTATQLIVVDPNANNNVAVGATNTEALLGTFTNPSTTGSTTTNIFLSDSTAIGSSQIAVTIGGLSTASITNGSGAQAVSLSNTDLSTQGDAQSALIQINAAISNVASTRGTLGASVNRLTAASNVINSQVQNLTSAENTITAADIPAAVANLTKFSILEQTGISALAQANQQQQLVLKLLQ
jgi:flagellin